MSKTQEFFIKIAADDLETVADMLKSNPELIQSHDPQGRSPLECAIQNKRTKVAIWLIDHGADVNAASLIGDGPLEMAKRARLHEVVNHLIANGAVPSQCSDSDIERMKEEYKEEFGKALTKGDLGGMKEAIALGGLNVKLMKNKDGMTPLEYAEANRKNIRNSDEIIWWLKQEADRTESD